MAYSWGDGPFGNRHKQSNRNNTNPRNTHLRLRNYKGPYDHASLSHARDQLCSSIERMQDSAVWCRIQRKTDVNIYGYQDLSDGFGEASTVFSHAGLPENQPEQGTPDDSYDQFSIDSPLSLPGKSGDTVAKSATATNLNSEVESLEAGRDTNEENDLVSDLILDEEVELEPEGSYNLEMNGIEIVQSAKGSYQVIVIEENTSDESQTEIPASTETLDDNSVIEIEKMNSAETGSHFTLKCDVCDYVSDDKTTMREHLSKDVHIAASMYSLDGPEKMKLNYPMVLKNLKAEFKTVLVFCPCFSCFKIFPNIHVCMEHFNVQHCKNKNERNQYGLIIVEKEEDCINAVNPKQCFVCFKQFDSRTTLNKHYKDMNHYPYTEVKNCQKIFFCFYCKSNFDSFESISLHQEISHEKATLNGVLKFTVFHYKNIETHKVFVDKENLSTSDNASPSNTESVQKTCRQEPDIRITKSGPSTGTSMRRQDGSSTELDMGTSQKNANEKSTEFVSMQGTSSGESELRIGTSKRKYDGNYNDMEPKIKITVNNEYAPKVRDMNENSIHDGKASLPGSSLTESEENEKTINGDSLTEIFKCDYCLKMIKHPNEMYLHLVKDIHSSASTVLVDQHENIVYLKETRTIKFDGAIFKKVAAICPDNGCRLLFDTIFICDEHNSRCHSSSERCYHLVDILDRCPIKVSVSENVCSTCGKSFRKSKQLNNHYTQSKHFPFPLRRDSNTYTLCCYCNKTFLSFKVASSHVKMHQNFARNGMLDLVVLYISKSPQKYTLPPYELTKTAEIASIRSKIESLQQLKKRCGKMGKSGIKKEVRELKHLL